MVHATQVGQATTRRFCQMTSPVTDEWLKQDDFELMRDR
jgi:hypothetical protein